MRRFLKIAIPVFVIGFVAGNAFWYLASPLWIDDVVDEALVGEDRLTEIATGSFAGADSIHKGQGILRVLRSDTGETLIRFMDFEVTNGPGLRVYLAKSANPAGASDVLDGGWTSLGVLKGNIGDQTYTLPADLDIADFGSVVIWCEPFSVLFASAPIGGS